MSIPVKNIYYLLCYAWNKLDEGERQAVSASDYPDAANLFARVITNGANHLLKRGLDRNYLEYADEFAGIKGKIEFTTTLNRQLLRKGRAYCITDELSYDILHNQILKAVIWLLARTKDVESTLQKELIKVSYRFSGVSDIEVKLSDFKRVQLHRNNANYDLLLRICEIIVANTVPDEQKGKYRFRDFMRDDTQMAKLFESFVRNFYRKEQSGYTVDHDYIYWSAEAIENSDLTFLPRMETDIMLKATGKRIIIDTKYYSHTLQSNFNTERFHSGNLNQIFSYLKNNEERYHKEEVSSSTGILLYPTNGVHIDQRYKIQGHEVRVCTIDLAMDWLEIHKSLLNIIS